MKKLSFVWLLFVLGTLNAQFNNEWIDYSKQYFKIKIAADGIYRITKNTLDAANSTLGSTPAQNFQLWHNGREVPLFTSVASGPLGNTDYIEFFGEKNDGKIDKSLYLNARYQLTDKVSLFTDTAIYFLTINSISNNLRFATVNNDLSGVLPAATPYVWTTVRHDYVSRGTLKPHVNKGAYQDYGEPVYSSAYDSSEMMSSDDIFPNQPDGGDQGNYAARFSNLLPYTGGGLNSELRISVAGGSTNTRSRDAVITLNGNAIATKTLSSVHSAIVTVPNLTPDNLQQATTIIGVRNVNPLNWNNQPFSTDRIVAGFVEIDYPRLPNGGGGKYLRFYIPSSTTETLIEITNFNAGSVAPVLYNISSGTRMQSVLEGNTVRLKIPATSSKQEFVLAAQSEGAYSNISNLSSRQFTNYSTNNLQGDYIIISNQRLLGDGTASNPVEKYREYRSSAAGGSYNAKIYDIDQLVDQFAFGVKMHPLSIKNFLRFARQNFTPKPKYCFLIGKGVNYADFRQNESHPQAAALQLIPTFGWPASDNILASDDLTALPATLIGRLNVISTGEVNDYLEKVKEYEASQANTTQSQTEKLWMKNAINVVGANDQNTAISITPYMNNYRNLLQGPAFGGKVTTFNKFNTTTASTIENEQLASLFQKGFSLLTYFGHSSATKLDYDLDDPSKYNNPGKYPNFMLLGCNAGNFYDFEVPRLQTKSTISEKYVLAANRGAVALIASTHFGLVSGLGTYATGFYQSVTNKSYGQSIGQHIYDAIQYMYTPPIGNTTSFSNRIHTEQQTLHGDPAIKINTFGKPDFSIEPPNVVINPSFISISETSFKVKIYHYNLGKAIQDSITLLVRRQHPNTEVNPNGLTDTVYFKKIKAPLYSDSLELTLSISPERDKGTNKILVSLETENRIDELDENNNTVSTDVEIFENELRPIYPVNYGIVNKQGVKLLASTANAFSLPQTYRMEIDTTEKFNSSIKITKDVISSGGLVEFDPGISYTDSTVYYWRLAILPTNGAPDRWNSSSFVYINGTETGFNQSHFYQHSKSTTKSIFIDSTSRKWNFTTVVNALSVTNAVYGEPSYTDDGSISVFVNSSLISASICSGYSTVFNVFDPVTFKPMLNYPGGLYGSGLNTCDAVNKTRQYNFEYDDRTLENRQKMASFMDAIPNGSFVVVRKFLGDDPENSKDYSKTAFADILKSDGPNSFYTKMKEAGFAELDSFNRPRVYIFIYKKGDNSFEPVWRLSDGLSDRADLSVSCILPDTLGYITSPILGPAKSWKLAQWRGNSLDNKQGDQPKVEVIGVNPTGNETVLHTLDINQQDFDISANNATTYPYIKLRMRNADSVNGTPYNLNWWRLYYTPVPEGALASNLVLQAKDTLEQGEPLEFKIAFKNVSETAFTDSIAVIGFVKDKSNTTISLSLPRKKALIVGDTAIISFSVDTKELGGVNTLYLAVNHPDSAKYQLEQYFFNNFLYKTFYVREDKYNPLLDVTFDGVHILNKDIVSSKPHIQIKLKDENKSLPLNDTAGLEVKLKFPGVNTPYRTYQWGTDTLRLTPPANPANDNTATVDFSPILSEDTDIDGEYELTVSGKDRSGNKAGNLDYRVTFKVFNKPMISNLLNYPNPFSTSTAFVFTITGNEVPQEFKIQILTITGKIVREITKQELGNIHIGTNITEYKWDGKDTYGSKLANGVYLYRVISSLDGKKMDKFKLNNNFNQNDVDATDQYFKKGYGKMVILR
jgi:hypothetical protein